MDFLPNRKFGKALVGSQTTLTVSYLDQAFLLFNYICPNLRNTFVLARKYFGILLKSGLQLTEVVLGLLTLLALLVISILQIAYVQLKLSLQLIKMVFIRTFVFIFRNAAHTLVLRIGQL